MKEIQVKPTTEQDKPVPATWQALLAGYRPGEIVTIEKPEPGMVRFMAASLLKVPLKAFAIRGGVGRFCKAEYQPFEAPDPDIVLCAGELSQDADRFHAAMLNFQRARRGEPGMTRWFGGVHNAARGVYASLRDLEPSAGELDFVMSWVAHVVSSGKALPSGMGWRDGLGCIVIPAVLFMIVVCAMVWALGGG